MSTRRPQSMAALELAQRRRLAAVRERNALIGAPIREVVEAVIHPSDDLAALGLGHLFDLRKGSTRSLIPKVGPVKLQRALDALASDGYRPLHRRTRLRELTERERRRLVRELIKHAPRAWREAA